MNAGPPEALGRREGGADLAWATLDASSSQVAVLDATGTIVVANRAWREFVSGDPDQPGRVPEGGNYLAACEERGSEGPEVVALALAIRAALAGQVEPCSIEYSRHVAAGKRWFVCTVSRLDVNEVPYVLVGHEDVTERKLAQEALEQAERHARGLIDNALEFVVTIDGEARYTYVSPSVEEAFGVSADEILGHPVYEFMHPEDVPLAAGFLRERIGVPGPSPPLEVRLLAKDGSWHVVEAVGNNLLDDPALGAVVINARDVTEQRETWEVARQSEELLRATLESTADGILVVGSDGRTLHANERFREMWRIPAEMLARKDDDEMLAYVLEQLLDPDEFLAKVRELYDSDKESFDTLVFKDGRLFERYSRPLTPEGTVTGRVWSFRDATERRRAEDALRQTEATYRMLVEQVPAVMYVDTPDESLQTTFVGPQIEEMLGVTPEEYVADPTLWERHLHPEDREETLAEALQFMKGDADTDYMDYRWVRPDGRIVWINDRAVRIRGEDGRPLSIQGFMFDVTDERRAEEALREAEAKYRALVEHVPAITYTDLIDCPDPARWPTVYISPQVEQILGYTPEEWIADPGLWERLVHPEDLERTLENDIAYPASGPSVGCEYRMYTRDGRIVWLRDESVLELDEEGVPRYKHGVLLDVTERHLAEEALREVEQRYRTLVEQIPAVVYMDAIDDLGTALYISPQYERLLGFTAEERVADPGLWARQLHPDDRDWVLAESTRTNETGEPFRVEYRMLAKDGGVVWIRDEAVILRDEAGGPMSWQGVLTDITDEKRAEDALREAEAKYRALVEQIPAITYMDKVNPDDALDTVPLYISPQVEAVLGYSPEEWVADVNLWVTLVHPDDRERVDQMGDVARVAGQPFNAEYRMVARDGRIVWIREGSVLVRDREGKPAFWQGIMLDVTERKTAEESLRDSLEQFRALATQAPVGIFRTDTSGHCVYVNERYCEITGLSSEEAKGFGWLGELNPDEREKVLAEWRESESRGTGLLFNTEVRWHKEGRLLWLATSAVGLRDTSGSRVGYLGTIMDITERKEAEEILRESEAELQRSLEVLRRTDEERRRLLAHLLEAESAERTRMAEGIEDRSLQDMAAVGMRLETLRRGLTDPEQLGAIDKLGETVQQALGRLKHVLVELRPRALEQDGLAAALDQYLRVVCAQGGPAPSLSHRLAEEPQMEVRSVAYRIAQEAISNAVDFASASHVDVVLEDRDEGVLVQVADDGCGFSVDEIYQTNQIGLASMRERAELAGGWFRLQSEPGVGTTVEFWLPGRIEQAGS